ncbi:hypothetical protein KY338_05005 [Candidatus Woesearchaeota archaeon]|nr:hypothetical protein [Candidatus Woesearchaeota archaeon]MBW3005841.1 hypothetical protein [Candidatus Woesearchaeota archaeon]
MTTETQVRDDVYKCIELLADWGGITVPREAYPEVTAVGEHSYYHPLENRINISLDTKEPGAARFEEASHFLRDFARPKTLIDKLGITKKASNVDEFFGRISDIIGREIIKNSTLKNIFENEEPRNHTKIYEFSGAIDYYIKKGKTAGFETNHEEACAISADFEDIQSKSVGLVRSWARDQDTEKCISCLEQCKQQIAEMAKNKVLKNNLVALFLGIDKISEVLTELIDDTIENVRRYETPKAADEGMDRLYRADCADSLNKYAGDAFESLKDQLNQLRYTNILKKDASELDHQAHFEGYTAAEMLTFEDLNKMRDIYTWPDSKVRKLFIKPLRKKLKEKFG